MVSVSWDSFTVKAPANEGASRETKRKRELEEPGSHEAERHMKPTQWTEPEATGVQRVHTTRPAEHPPCITPEPLKTPSGSPPELAVEDERPPPSSYAESHDADSSFCDGDMGRGGGGGGGFDDGDGVGEGSCSGNRRESVNIGDPYSDHSSEHWGPEIAMPEPVAALAAAGVATSSSGGWSPGGDSSGDGSAAPMAAAAATAVDGACDWGTGAGSAGAGDDGTAAVAAGSRFSEEAGRIVSTNAMSAMYGSAAVAGWSGTAGATPAPGGAAAGDDGGGGGDAYYGQSFWL